MNEIWKEIPGFERYDASNMGRIRTWIIPGGPRCGGERPGRRNKPVIMKPTPAKMGKRLIVRLRRNERYHNFYAHQLILLTFVGPCPEGMECCHNNGDAFDNRLENLRWDSHYNNSQDAVKFGEMPRGERNASSKLTEQQVIEIRERVTNGEMQSKLALEFKVGISCINGIYHRRTWKHI